MASVARLCALHRWVGDSRPAHSPAKYLNLRQFQRRNKSYSEPFYGRPRPRHRHQHEEGRQQSRPRTFQERIAIAVHSAMTAFSDPTRADAVAALGDVTSPVSLRRMYEKMSNDPTGRLILQERPMVSKTTIPYERLIKEAPSTFATGELLADDEITFGQAYGAFLKQHGFDPDERDAVKYIEDDDLAYVMLRYRQCHDFWHALAGLPPTVLGELGIKWLELFQTGLPVAALSATVGSMRLNSEERGILLNIYLPWALRVSQNSGTGSSDDNNDDQLSSSNDSPFLMNVYYEHEFDTPLKDLRRRLHLEAAPVVES